MKILLCKQCVRTYQTVYKYKKIYVWCIYFFIVMLLLIIFKMKLKEKCLSFHFYFLRRVLPQSKKHQNLLRKMLCLNNAQQGLRKFPDTFLIESVPHKKSGTENLYHWYWITAPHTEYYRHMVKFVCTLRTNFTVCL